MLNYTLYNTNLTWVYFFSNNRLITLRKTQQEGLLMNFRSHIIMGNILYNTLQTRLNIPLNRSEFIYGNIRPDIYPGFIARHTKDKFFAYVKSEIS